MTWRIVEKKDEWKLQEKIIYNKDGMHGGMSCGDNRCRCAGKKYHPCFVVEERQPNPNVPREFLSATFYKGEDTYLWVEVNRFTNLEDARQYKRDLELEEGIVIE